jgi:hypothetical protein
MSVDRCKWSKPMFPLLPAELAQREHVGRYLRIRAALRAEAERAAAASVAPNGSSSLGAHGRVHQYLWDAESPNGLAGLL